MNAPEGGGESGMRQQDGGNHDEGNVVVVGVRERVGAGLEASEGDTVSSFKGSLNLGRFGSRSTRNHQGVPK